MSFHPDIPNTRSKTIPKSAFFGLWEVFRICRENSTKTIYPWIGERFRYYFLDEMMYICSKDGKPCHGTWRVSMITNKGKKNGLSLILDDKVAYRIIDFSTDVMTLSDDQWEYYLVKKL